MTGRRPFEADTVPETLAAVMRDDVAFDRLPERVRPLLRKCLEKDPAKRLRDIGDAWALLEASAVTVQAAPVSMERTSNWLWPGVAALLAIALVATLWAPWRTAPADRVPVRFQIPFPEGRIVQNFAISPDGRTLVMQVRTIEGVRLWLRALDSLEARDSLRRRIGCRHHIRRLARVGGGSRDGRRVRDYRGGELAVGTSQLMLPFH
jgi:serine/threonine-protein kinase